MVQLNIPNLAAAPGLNRCCARLDDALGDRFDEVGVVVDSHNYFPSHDDSGQGAHGFCNRAKHSAVDQAPRLQQRRVNAHHRAHLATGDVSITKT